MATPAQILANRENAQLSTGPRTSEGKVNSSLNNLQHGLAARGFIVLPGQEAAFADLESGLRTSLCPTASTLQECTFLRILEAAWNLQRCRLAQAQLYLASADLNIDPLLDDQNEAKFARIQKYAKQNENSMRKALAELSKLQTENQYRHEAFPLTEEQNDDDELFNQTPHALSDVCQFAEVMDALAREKRYERATKKDGEAEAMRMLQEFCAPPPHRQNFQSEPNLHPAKAQAA